MAQLMMSQMAPIMESAKHTAHDIVWSISPILLADSLEPSDPAKVLLCKLEDEDSWTLPCEFFRKTEHRLESVRPDPQESRSEEAQIYAQRVLKKLDPGRS